MSGHADCAHTYVPIFLTIHLVSSQWTVYPNFGKEGPKTINGVYSGIQVGDNKDIMMLVEAVYAKKDTGTSEEINQMTLRGVETLRHLPVVVRQFDIDGKIMDQNPEAIKLFGCHRVGKTRNSDQPEKENECEFLDRFEDRTLGQKVLRTVQEGDDYQLEVRQKTNEGTKWFSVKVRRARDPVTSENVIIYSARDVSEIMQRAKEEAERINMERSEFFAVMAHEIR